MEYVIGVDLGTSGTKTVLFDRNGQTVAASTVEYPLYQPFNGWAVGLMQALGANFARTIALLPGLEL